MKLVRDVKRIARLHPKLFWGSVAGGVVALGGIAYAATRPKKKTLADVMLASSQFVPYALTVMGGLELEALTKRLLAMADVLSSNNLVFVQQDAFRKILTHQGVKVLDLIPGIFYKDNKFTTDTLADHSWCQTFAAEVVGLGNDWVYPFYHTVYREPDYVQPQTGVHYAGNAIPADDPRFQQRVEDAINAAVNNAITNADFGGAIASLKKFGVQLPFALPSDFAQLLMIPVPPGTKENLGRFARDLAAKQNKTLPTTDSDGKPLPPNSISLLHGSIGAMAVAGLIDMFESHDEKVNPCIKVVDAQLVFEMFMVTIGTVLGLALGPALSAVSLAIKFVSTVNKLAELSK